MRPSHLSLVERRLLVVVPLVLAVLVGLFFGWTDYLVQGIFFDDHAPQPPLNRVRVVRWALAGAVAAWMLSMVVVGAGILVARIVRNPSISQPTT